jgi:hypothetical protein
LIAVFQHCAAFDTVSTGDDCYSDIKQCQTETTMPFNDYWSTSPGLVDMNLNPYFIAAAVAALAFVVGLFSGTTWLTVLGLLGIVAVIAVGLNAIVTKARLPFPKSPPPGVGSDLPTVLKALALQREFTAFAIAAQGQGQDDRALQAAFGEFLANGKPNDTSMATQPPGVIGV